MQEPKQLLVLPQSHRQRAMEGCHDQVGHLGQDRVLDLLRDRFYWPGMHADVVSIHQQLSQVFEKKVLARQGSTSEHRDQSATGVNTFGLSQN